MTSTDWAETLARHLLEEPLPRRWAHTTGVGATARTLAGLLGDQADLLDALIYCDMTTGPDGQRMPVDQRLGEILTRYGPDHVVSRAITRSAAELTAAADRVIDRLTVLAEPG